MNNQFFEFKSYTPTPTDQYMLGIAKVKLFGKVVANYKHVKTKDGTGDFFCTASYTMTDASGEKKYTPCILLDSRDDEEELLEFIRKNVHMAISQRSAHKQNSQAQPQSGQYYPHGMIQNQATTPAWPQGNFAVPLPGVAISHEVAADEQIPF